MTTTPIDSVSPDTAAQPATVDHAASRRQLTSGQEPMLQFFSYAHLPPHLQSISEPFSVLAHLIVETVARNPERFAALHKLLEAKDCAVRAVLYKS